MDTKDEALGLYNGGEVDEFESTDREMDNIFDENKITADGIAAIKDPFRQNRFSAVLSKIDEVDEMGMKSPVTDDEGDSDGKTDSEENDIDYGKSTAKSPQAVWKSENKVVSIGADDMDATKRRPRSANYAGNSSTKHRSECKKSHQVSTIPGTMESKPVLRNTRCRSGEPESNSEDSIISAIGKQNAAESTLHSRKCHTHLYDSSLWNVHCCPPRPRSACSTASAFNDAPFLSSKGLWLVSEAKSKVYQPRKCKSSPNIIRSCVSGEAGADLKIDKFKRSLKLLGLEVTDFGISECDSEFDVAKLRKVHGKRRHAEPTFSTKVVKRSISLNGLREIVRDAWLDDRLDSSHRRILARAAYEEWYFRKTEEAKSKLVEERRKEKEMKEQLESEFKCRSAKADEQFRKWIEGKRIKWKRETDKKASSDPFRFVKSKEEVESAFQRWKKKKDKQMREKHKLELEEREKELAVEKQKEEKKVLAAKAYTEWKRKHLETERILAETKLRKEKKRKEMEFRRKEQEKKTSFQTWKNMKDKQLLIERLEKRNTLRIASALQSAKMEERMYEAEQAFEEWLEKIELREITLKSKKSVS